MTSTHQNTPLFADYLTEQELAKRWRRTVRSLQRWRAGGTAPTWHHVGGRILYHIDDVTAFEAAGRTQGVGS